jgi:membrane-associated progesterone receptor component
MKQFTLEQLAGHDGSDPSKPMLLSIRGVVYDITTGKQFYGPDGARTLL